MILKCIQVGFPLACTFVFLACATSSRQDETTQVSLGYRFVQNQEQTRGVDDDSNAGTRAEVETGVVAAPSGEETSEETVQSAPSPTTGVLALEPPPETGVDLFTPSPYPEEWMSPPPETGFFANETRAIIIIVVLGVVIIIAGIQAVRNW